LDLDQWAALIARYAHARGVTIHVEPGDYLVKDAGVLLVQVNSVEEKGGTEFVGVNAGFNLQNLPVYYQTPFVVVPLREKEGVPHQTFTIAGNINEAIDLLAEAVALPHVEEEDYLALLNVGGYGRVVRTIVCAGSLRNIGLQNRRPG
jgi:diaminopimelate decarboxylase